ncbi:MAG: DUF6763 family protein [Thiohalomonadaceae bacterium]
MATDADPVVGNWYRHLDKGYRFEVVAVDEDEGTVEIQHFDGDIEALDIDTWYEMDIEPTEPPEDWSGPVDDFEEEDLDYTETDMEEDDWDEPLGELERPRRSGGRKRKDEDLEEIEDLGREDEYEGWREED